MPRRILILGGTGVFGSRIAQLLAQPSAGQGRDLEIVIAGRRSDRAAALAARLEQGGVPARAVSCDRDRDLGTVLARERPTVFVDASGPFQAYGGAAGKPDYGAAKLCIEAAVPYIDIADARAFVSGIELLDEAAKAAGVPVLSGASSVPCLSGAVALELASELERVDGVRTWIAPGNIGAPRGRSVVAAILAGVGRPILWRRGGRWVRTYGWQDLRRIVDPDLGRRWLAACDVPDLDLIPRRWPEIGEATFHAGLELGLLHFVLWSASWLVRARPATTLAALASPVSRIATALGRFGTDVGAMRVEVAGLQGGEKIRRRWTVIARSGHGAWIPAAPAAALARRCCSEAPPGAGARAAFGDIGTAEILSELRGLDIAVVVSPSAASVRSPPTLPSPSRGEGDSSSIPSPLEREG
jgi:saccharopine dehydrogenase-like NADP-dependent oxidoreductase